MFSTDDHEGRPRAVPDAVGNAPRATTRLGGARCGPDKPNAQNRERFLGCECRGFHYSHRR